MGGGGDECFPGGTDQKSSEIRFLFVKDCEAGETFRKLFLSPVTRWRPALAEERQAKP